jgi:chemotaxis protein CheD
VNDDLLPPRRPTRDILVGISAMAVSNDPDSVLVTHNLGSCIAVCVHDPVSRIGGLLHYMMPLSTERAPTAPLRAETYADTGVPLLFERLYALGGVKTRMRVVVAGGATISKATQAASGAAIGTRNYLVLRKMFWQNQVIIAADDVGGIEARSVRMDVGTGVVTVTTLRGERTL